MGPELVSGGAGEAHGVAERLAREHGPVEAVCERGGRPVVHLPAGGDDRPHAHVDEPPREVRGEAVAAGPEGGLVVAALDPAEGAAIDEHDLGHRAHLLDLVRGEEGIVPDDHPGHRPPPGPVAGDRAAVGLRILVDAVPGQVQDPVVGSKKGAEDLAGPGRPVVARGHDRGHLVSLGRQHLRRARGFGGGAGQTREAARRVADHQRLPGGRRHHLAPAVAMGGELSDDADLHGERLRGRPPSAAGSRARRSWSSSHG